jgi:beta-galactosidase
VKVDNRTDYKERSSDTPFEWNANDFNPDHGGINRHVWLHVTGKIYQTLPLYDGLESTGVYVHAANFNLAAKARRHGRIGSAQCVRRSRHGGVVGRDRRSRWQVRARLDGDPVDMVDGEKTELTATGALQGARFWSPDDPYLYDVYTILTVDGKTVDVDKVVTGFRKTEFKGGAGTGGVYLNGKFVYLKGFAQRASNEWAGLVQAYPDWMHDFRRR